VTLRGLAEWNGRYEDRYGFLFLVCATGKTAEEMLGILMGRMNNSPEKEVGGGGGSGGGGRGGEGLGGL